MRDLLRKHTRYFLIVGLVGLGLRLLFALRFPAIVDDSRLYANIAQTWLQHGIYGLTSGSHIFPTLSRLPGYPLFLAAVFVIFGHGHFLPVLLTQVAFDLLTCFLIADMARRFAGPHAAKIAFLLAATCPFLANYAGTALTETMEIFFTTLSLDLAAKGLSLGTAPPDDSQAIWMYHARMWFACGLAIAGAILLRPDGGILLAAIGAYLCYRFLRVARAQQSSKLWAGFLRTAVVLAAGALLPLAPWTIRNLHTFHVFEPLAPRYANDPGEPPLLGFNRWVKTWMAEYVSVQEIYWNVPDDAIDVKNLPIRAFDSPAQKRETEQIFAQYNQNNQVTQQIDAEFAALAQARIHADPLRYYVWLPSLRILDMWFRPRTELTSADPRWWEFNDDRRWLALSIGLGAINMIYVGMAAFGLLRARKFSGVGLFVFFVLVRSLFLGTMENPEPRYTLECYPVVVIFAATLFIGMKKFPA